MSINDFLLYLAIFIFGAGGTYINREASDVYTKVFSLIMMLLGVIFAAYMILASVLS